MICAVLVVAAVAACGNKKPAQEPETSLVGQDSTDPADTSDAGMVPAEAMEEINRLLERKRPAVSRCLSAAIDAKELPKTARGKVNLAIVVGTNRRADSVKVLSSNLDSKSLQDCVVAKVQEIPFPAIPKSYETSYAYGFEAM